MLFVECLSGFNQENDNTLSSDEMIYELSKETNKSQQNHEKIRP